MDFENQLPPPAEIDIPEGAEVGSHDPPIGRATRELKQPVFTALFGLGWLLVASLNPGRSAWELGYVLGTTFGQGTLASAWAPLGLGRFVWRLPFSLAWLTCLVVAVACNIWVHKGPKEIPLMIAGCLLGQFLLLQLAFGTLVAGYGLRLRPLKHDDDPTGRSNLQFGIRELLVITAAIAVVLGLGRLAIQAAPLLGSRIGRDTPIFALLVVAAVVTSVPLVLAVLLQKRAGVAAILAIVFFGLVTATEDLLFRQLRPGPTRGMIVLINFFTATWILTVTAIVRQCGYRLRRSTWPSQRSLDS